MNLNSDDLYAVFINKKYLGDLDYNNDMIVSKFVKGLLYKYNKRMNIKSTGLFNVNLYVDDYYGAVMSVRKEELEYFDYYSFQMEYRVIKGSFLYEVLDYNDFSFEFDVYKNFDKIYLKIKDDLEFFDIGRLCEYTRIVYGDEVKKIIRNAEKVG